MKNTKLEKINDNWISSYIDKEGVRHDIASEGSKEELIHSMSEIIMRLDGFANVGEGVA